MNDRSSQLYSYGLALLIPVLGVFAVFTALQRHLIYFPSHASAEDLTREGARLRLEPWLGSDGASIGWKPTARQGAHNRMLVFHGNAGYALHRTYFVSGLQAQGEQWEVRLFEYPGYGAREGRPSEATLKAAAAEALKMLLATDARPIFLAGESLGSGVASHLAGSFPDQVAGLLLVTPFSSLVDVAAHHYPFLPVRSLLRERYDATEALSRYHGPVAFVLAGRDEVVPTRLGQQLYDGYTGPKWLRVEAHATHNSLTYHPEAVWWSEVSKFLTAQY